MVLEQVLCMRKTPDASYVVQGWYDHYVDEHGAKGVLICSKKSFAIEMENATKFLLIYFQYRISLDQKMDKERTMLKNQ